MPTPCSTYRRRVAERASLWLARASVPPAAVPLIRALLAAAHDGSDVREIDRLDQEIAREWPTCWHVYLELRDGPVILTPATSD